VRDAACVGGLSHPVPLDHRSIYAFRTDVVGARAPRAKKVSPRAVGLGGPIRPVLFGDTCLVMICELHYVLRQPQRTHFTIAPMVQLKRKNGTDKSTD